MGLLGFVCGAVGSSEYVWVHMVLEFGMVRIDSGRVRVDMFDLVGGGCGLPVVELVLLGSVDNTSSVSSVTLVLTSGCERGQLSLPDSAVGMLESEHSLHKKCRPGKLWGLMSRSISIAEYLRLGSIPRVFVTHKL